MDEKQKLVQKQKKEGRIANPKKPILLLCINTIRDKIVGWKKATPTNFYTCRIAADLLSKEEGKRGIESERGVSSWFYNWI